MDKIRIGVVGTNFISDWMVEGGRKDPRCEWAAVCSRKEETGRAFADKHGIEHVFTDVADMAASPLIDAAYIASPNACHAAQAITFLKAGKHVLCEKPLASNAVEAAAMIETARRSGKVLMEAVIPTLSPVFTAVREYLPRVGKVRRYFASYCQYSSRYDRLKRGDVANAFRPELSNGAVMDIGVYCLYPMAALFGEPLDITTSAMKLPTGVDGQGTIVCRYDGFDAVSIYSKIADSKLPTEIQGEDGTITIDRINDPRHVTFQPHDRSLPAIDITPATDIDDPYYHEMREFIDVITTGKSESSRNSLATSLITMHVIDTVRRASGVSFPADQIMPLNNNTSI